MTMVATKVQQPQQDEISPFIDLDEVFYLDVISGLRATQKKLSPKYFYDTQGSRYFDEICQLREYYPYLTELALLPRIAQELNEVFRKPLNIVEFGAGSLSKIKPLLNTVESVDYYMPIDISAEWLQQCCDQLREQFPRITMQPIAADFTTEVVVPDTGASAFGFFPGSTIGNFTPDEALDFLVTARNSLGADAHLLIGVDTKKSTEILHKAYNDNKGVTARFNLNILERMNRELNADFDLSKFEHYAFYNVHLGCVEMHLVSLEDQRCSVGDQEISFGQGESIHTESSYKYTPDEFQQLAGLAGWRTEKIWMAEKDMFSVFLLHA